MNQLAKPLKEKRIGRAAILGPDIESEIEEADADNFREELERLLESFESEEIRPEEQVAEVSLEESVFLLLT
jgi:hypothetical protein